MDARNSRPVAVIGPRSERLPGGIAAFNSKLIRTLEKDGPSASFEWSRPYPGVKKCSPEEPALDYFSPASWRNTAAAIRRMEPRAVLLNWVHPVQLPPVRALIRLLEGIPVWAICHNVKPHEPCWGWKPLTRIALSGVAGIVVHSSVSYEEVARILPRARIEALFLPPLLDRSTLGTPSSHDASTPTEEPEHAQFRIVFFGHLRPYKGIETLLDAFARFRSSSPEAELVIAGSPIAASLSPGRARRYVQSLEERAASLGLEKVVRFEPRYLSDDELRALLHSASAAVFPYRSVSASGSIITALGHGIPVVASRLPGLSEIIVPGVNGWLAEPDDAESFASAFSAAAHSRPGREAVRATIQRFSFEEYARRLRSFL